jgi:uncharacterized membrane protein
MRGLMWRFVSRVKATLIWAVIPISVGAILNYLFGLGFWFCTIMVAISLVLNGWLADHEDKGTFND